MRIRNLTVTNFMVLANSQPFEYIITQFYFESFFSSERPFLCASSFSIRRNRIGRQFANNFGDSSSCRSAKRGLSLPAILSTRSPYALVEKTSNHKANAKKEMNRLFRSSSWLHNNNNNLHFRWLWNNCRRNGSMMNFLNEPKRKTERFYLGTMEPLGRTNKKLPTFIDSMARTQKKKIGRPRMLLNYFNLVFGAWHRFPRANMFKPSKWKTKKKRSCKKKAGIEHPVKGFSFRSTLPHTEARSVRWM